MNKQETLQAIAKSVRHKHPWYISQEKYLSLFGELPLPFLEERLAYDNLIVKAKQFHSCRLVLSEVKVEIKLSIDELIKWEMSLDKWQEAGKFDIVPGDIKKLLQ